MASTALGRRLVACLLNISEARRKDLVETVAKAALYDPKGVRREGTTVLNIFNDHDYNRSVITIVSAVESITVMFYGYDGTDITLTPRTHEKHKKLQNHLRGSKVTREK